jgi:hypothetical protein
MSRPTDEPLTEPPLSQDSIFPLAMSTSVPTTRTLVQNTDLVQALVSSVLLHVSTLPELSLTAKSEDIAAVSMYNLILGAANARYGSSVTPVPSRPEDYRWYPSDPTTFRSLFKKDFFLSL